MEGTDPINSLPEYKIRTMKDDLSGTPENLPTKIEEKPKPIPKPTPAPEPKPMMATPMPTPAPVKQPEPVRKPIFNPEALLKPEPTPKITKAPLPTIEELINIAPKKIEKPSVAPKKQISLEEPEEPKKRKSKFLLILGILILIAIIIGAFFFWQGTKPEPTTGPEPTGNETNETPELPASLMPVDETETVSLRNAPLFNHLIDQSNIKQPANTFKRIFPQRNDNAILPLNDLIEELQISVYPYVYSELENNYTLVLYSQNDKISIGILIKTKNPDKVREQMKYWEPTMANDLKNLFLDKNPGNTITQQFKGNPYNETLIRYISFINFNAAIDYAVKGDILILTTSKEAMFGIIDKL